MDEVREFSSGTERDTIEELGTLFTIIRVTEALEAAYSRDAVTEKKYTEECLKLIAQFKSTENALMGTKTIKYIKVYGDISDILSSGYREVD